MVMVGQSPINVGGTAGWWWPVNSLPSTGRQVEVGASFPPPLLLVPASEGLGMEV